MATLGSFSLLIALAFAAYNFFAGAMALWLAASGRPARVAPERLATTARRAGIAAFAAVTAASFALVWAAFTNDFSITYIAEHSNRALPGAYKFAALWSGQEGSLLFWAWLLGLFSFILNLRYKQDTTLYAYAGTIMASVELFFLVVLNFNAPPFSLLTGTPIPDGNGLNPLLQYWEMVIHPPMLYLGYVGFTVPFAFALGALIMRYPGERWIGITRVWTLVSWLLLTIGIFLGMHWAYAVLGWGGYWGWDPVENASLMPWLTGTAFLHSVMMQERRGMMKGWNMLLIFSTFLLTLLGTMLTRGGLVSSVHAFAESSIGYWFMVFMGIVILVCAYAYIRNRKYLESENHIEALVSREASFLFSNLVLLLICFLILWGTLYPILSEVVEGAKVTIGAPFYNRIAVPIGLFLLMMTGVGPLLPWRSTSFKTIRRNFVLPVIALWVTVIACLVAGVRPWAEGKFQGGDFYALVGFSLAAAVLVAILSEFLRGARVIVKLTRRNIFFSSWTLIRSNTRRYGGYLVHIGVVAAILGLCGAAFNKTTESELGLNDKMSVGPYTLVCSGFTQDSNENYDTEYAMLDVSYHGKQVFQLAPERRVYLASGQPQTMVAIHSVLFWDLYVVYEGANPDTGQPIIKAFLNPLVSWIWVGMLIIVLGTLLALLPTLKLNGRALAAGAKKSDGGN